MKVVIKSSLTWVKLPILLIIAHVLLLHSCRIEAPDLPSLNQSQNDNHKRPKILKRKAYSSVKLSAWHSYQAPHASDFMLLKPASHSLSDLPIKQQLCARLYPHGPPTITWKNSISPALEINPLPSQAQALLILMLDWDMPDQRFWRALNETYQTVSELTLKEITRKPHYLWGSVLLSDHLNDFQTHPNATIDIPAGFGGQGNPFQLRFFEGRSYQALNQYSFWFSHLPLYTESRGYAGPCIPAQDPQVHQITVFAFALSNIPNLPSEGSPVLSAETLWQRAASSIFAVSRFDWQARLRHASIEELNAP